MIQRTKITPEQRDAARIVLTVLRTTLRTETAIAQRLGVSINTVSRWLKGEHYLMSGLALKAVQNLCELLHYKKCLHCQPLRCADCAIANVQKRTVQRRRKKKGYTGSDMDASTGGR